MAKKRRNNRLIWILLGCIILLLSGAVMAKKMGWIGKPKHTKVATEKVKQRTITETVSASGKIFPEVEIKMSPDVSGEIVQLTIQEGDSVRKGQLLAKINPDIYLSMVDRAKAAVNSAQSNEANAESRILQSQSRIQQIDARREQLKARLEQGQTLVQQAQARVDQAKSRRQQIQARVDQSKAGRTRLQANIDQINARKKSLELQIADARRNHKRNKELFADDVIAQIELDRTKLTLESLENDLLSIPAELKGIEADKTRIDAELRGIEAEKISLEADIKSLEAALRGTRADVRSIGTEELSIDAELAGLEADVSASQKTAEGAGYNVKSAEASLKEAEDNLSRTRLYAPMTGIVSMLAAEKGERVVGTSQFAGTEIIRIADFSEMEVRVDVSENDIIRVNLGDTAIVEVDAYIDRDFKGIVTQIANSSQSTNAGNQLTSDQITNFTVKIRILRDDYKDLFKEQRFPFRPGMSASVDIQTKTAKNVVSAPIQAVSIRAIPDSLKTGDSNEDETEEIVYLYNAKTKKVMGQKVTTGIQNETYIQILTGLAANQEIVTAPYRTITKKLKDDMKVERVDKKALFKKEE